MAIFRLLKSLAQKSPNHSIRTFFNLSYSSPPNFLYQKNLNSFCRSANLLSPLSKFIIQGPLFLSSPPWKLSQSATPFYFQSDVVFLPKIKALGLFRIPDFRIDFVGGSASGQGRRLFQEKGVVESDGFVESLMNLPNFISMSRLVSGPFIGWMIVQEMYLPAFVGLAVSGATDWLDGYVARKMGINSVVGSYLDPLADKVLIGCVALAMVDKGLLDPGLVGLILVRDVALVGGAVYNRAKSLDWKWKSWHEFLNLDGTHAQRVEPLLISKVNTVFQLVLVTAALVQPEFGTSDTQPYITYLSWLVASTTMASTAAYGVQYLRARRILRKSI